MRKIIPFFTAVLFSITIYAQQDHSEFIEGPFTKPQEVTQTCLDCHEGVDKDIIKTRHWNWQGKKFTVKNRDTIKFGKQDIINNFCIAVPSNWARCTSCHIGYGWKDEKFDFTDGTNIDCLVCHDQTGTYQKTPTGAGMPEKTVDLVKVAQSVGKTSNRNCGICHFNGGGGTGVKHGDLDGSMINPSPDLDIHMGRHQFTCSNCHSGEKHQIKGASHGSLQTGNNHISCTNCHDRDVHKRSVLNKHIKSVACETCHIPTFARKEPTKVWWDWSTAGQDKETTKDEYGMDLYSKKKGDFKWDKNVVPEYRWHNGQADYYMHGDKIDPEKVVVLNTLKGSYDDPNSKITPFKLMKGKQIYDSKNNYLIVPKLYGKDGYWKTFDWNSAAKLGMLTIGLDYSGEYDFIETEMYWPINHMVVPKNKALKCMECHSSKKSKRLDWEQLGYKGDPMKRGGRF